MAKAERLTHALDDTPTPRYGPHVQGAGVHHNQTPGPAGSPSVYGHVFVVLGLLVAHPARGTIALPLLSRQYVPLHFRVARAIERALAGLKVGRPMPGGEAVDLYGFEDIVGMSGWQAVEEQYGDR